MEWVEEFYTKQQAWSGIYTSDVSEHHRSRALLLQRLAGGPPQSVLEVGAGGGQTAQAMAELGYQVTAVELLPLLVAHARQRTRRLRTGSLEVIHGDFYTVQFNRLYDVVCYWDGFGIGEDEDQARLLRRMAQWIQPAGVVLLDIYSPWYWAQAAGREMAFGTVMRRYGFDPHGNRMLDSWWPIGREQDQVSQSLRCYAPADLRLLLRGTGLRLATEDIVPGGAVDYDQGTYLDHVHFDHCMSYTVKLVLE